MVNWVKGNAIDYVLEDKDSRILLHCCNAQGVMGSGIAKEIKDRVPSAYESYTASRHKLGTTSSDVDRIVINMVAQEFYGKQPKRYISYKALAECLVKISKDWEWHGGIEFVIPYKMGSDRAGGDWDMVLEICQGILGDENITVVELN